MRRSSSLPQVVKQPQDASRSSNKCQQEKRVGRVEASEAKTTEAPKRQATAAAAAATTEAKNEPRVVFAVPPKLPQINPFTPEKRRADPYRMIKITEIIEINSNPDDDCAFNESTTTTTTTASMNKQNDADLRRPFLTLGEPIKEKTPVAKLIHTRYDHVSSRDETSWSNIVSSAPVAAPSEPPARELPILVEKVSQTCIDDIRQDKNPPKVDESKPAEIVVEIINVCDEVEQTEQAKEKLFGSLLNDLSSAQGGNGVRPKKITIRITGKTRSVSSDKPRQVETISQKNSPILEKQQQQQQPSSVFKPAKTCFSPFTAVSETKPLPVLRNSASLEVKNFESFRPIQQRLESSSNQFSELNFNPSCSAQLASEEDSTLTLSEAKFDLDKFKSYLSSFNTGSEQQQQQQRSISMPPNATLKNKPFHKTETRDQPYVRQFETKNNVFVQNDLYRTSDMTTNGLLRARDSLSTNGVIRRTAFNSRKNLSFMEDRNIKAASDTDEPVWTYRTEEHDSRALDIQPNTKKNPPKQSSLSTGAQNNSKRFGCGLFNKASRLSVKLEEEENEPEETSDAQTSFKENSEMSSSRRVEGSRTPRYDHVFLAKANSSKSPQIELKAQGQHQPRKKISSYYNDFYSNKNRSGTSELSDSSTTHFIDDDATTITSNEEIDDDDDDTEIDCDCNEDDGEEMSLCEEIINEEPDVFDFKKRQETKKISSGRLKFSTFLPSQIKETGTLATKTPKLVRKVLFADQI